MLPLDISQVAGIEGGGHDFSILKCSPNEFPYTLSCPLYSLEPRYEYSFVRVFIDTVLHIERGISILYSIILFDKEEVNLRSE
jgi:hypothetical protein